MLTAASPQPGQLVTAIVERLELPSLGARQAIIDAPITPEAFDRAFAEQAVLHVVEQRQPASPARPGREARIVFWNAERLKYLDQIHRHALGVERRRARPVRSGCRHGPLGRQAHDRRPCGRDVGGLRVRRGIRGAGPRRPQGARPVRGTAQQGGAAWRGVRLPRRASQAGPGAAGDVWPLVRRRVP